MPPEKLEPGAAPPPDYPWIVVTLIQTSREVSVAVLIEDDDGALMQLGPYVFQTDDPAENEALGMQAAETLRAKYGGKIYIQIWPSNFPN